MDQNKSTADSLNIFSYDDYRNFLADFYSQKKAQQPQQFSFRVMSTKAGFKTPSFIPYVIQGKRNLTLESIEKIAGLVPLKGRPLEYFKTLVMFNQAKSNEDRNRHYDTMKEFKEYVQMRLLTNDQCTYMLKWYYPVVREIVRWPSFRPEPQWVASKIKPRIFVEQAKEALDVLQSLQMISVNPDGSWKQAFPKVGSPDQGVGKEVLSFYDKAILLGRDSLKLPASERNISSMIMSLSPASFELIRYRINEFQKELNGIISQEVTPEHMRAQQIPEDIINQKEFFDVSEVGLLNIQFFKVAKAKGYYE